MAKQLKISELKRVVNVDEMAKLAAILSDTQSSKGQITSALDRLNDKTPSKEVLLTTSESDISAGLNRPCRDIVLFVKDWALFSRI